VIRNDGHIEVARYIAAFTKGLGYLLEFGYCTGIQGTLGHGTGARSKVLGNPGLKGLDIY
jgi:hypothetical protein